MHSYILCLSYSYIYTQSYIYYMCMLAPSMSKCSNLSICIYIDKSKYIISICILKISSHIKLKKKIGQDEKKV